MTVNELIAKLYLMNPHAEIVLLDHHDEDELGVVYAWDLEEIVVNNVRYQEKLVVSLDPGCHQRILR